MKNRLVGMFLSLAAGLNYTPPNPLDTSGLEHVPRTGRGSIGKGKGKQQHKRSGAAANQRAARKRANIRKNPKGAR